MTIPSRMVIPICLLIVAGLIILVAFSPIVEAKSHPHMENALWYLNNAKSELHWAKANNGGHRDTAIEYVEKAINEVSEGIVYMNSHPRNLLDK